MVELNPVLAKRVQVYADRLYLPENDAVLVPAEPGALHGHDPSLLIVDELHVVRRHRASGYGPEGWGSHPSGCFPSALTPVAVQLRRVAGARWAIPRRIHGVRLAITSTARSDRRIAVRGPEWALTPVPPRPIPPARRGDRPPAVARCRARHAARRCRGPQSPCPTRRPGHGRCGNEDFAGAGLAEDPRRDVYGDPPDVGVQQFALAGVDAGADLDAQCLGVSAQGLGAADGLRRAVERGEVAVTGALYHRAAESLREVGGDFTKPLEHRPPPLVARRRGVLGRRDHVGEQHGAQGAM